MEICTETDDSKRTVDCGRLHEMEPDDSKPE